MSTAATYEHQRPSVLGSDLRRFWSLAWTLAVTDWKLRFYGSVLGYLWTLVRPFAFFGVVYFVFTDIIGLNKNIPNYGVYILFSLVLFQFFGEITGNSVQSLVVRENLLRKMRFPRLVIPLAIVLTAIFNLIGTLAAVLIFALISGVYPGWGWLELPLLIGILALFATGIGLTLGALYVRFRDIQPIWEVVSQMLFYASPVLYVSTFVPEAYQRPYHANPIAAVFCQMRHAVVDPGAPAIWTAIGGVGRVFIPLGITLAALVVGLLVFRREAPRIAENL